MDRLIQANIVGDKTIILSEHKDGSDVIIPNSLNMEMINVSCTDTALFVNELDAEAPIPDIDEKQEHISVIYVYFPLGDGDAYLTTEALAKKIICYAPYNWGVEQAYNETYGVYFKIYPLYDYKLAPRDKLYISLIDLVSFGQLEKMVYVAVRFSNVLKSDEEALLPQHDEYNDGTDYLAYFKKRSPLKILNFTCNRTKVAVGDTVTLEWAVAGDAVKCILTPGDIAVDRSGSLELEIFSDTTIRLYAFGEHEQVSQTVFVYVEQPVITSFTSNCPDHSTRYGEPIVLSYEVKDGYSIYLNQGIGRVSESSISVVPKRAKTEYMLSCMGTDQLVQQSITITVTDFLEVRQLRFIRGGRRADGSYMYFLKWIVANCTTIQLVTSDGQVRSTGEAKGEIQFLDCSVEALKVTVHCTGTSGQSIEQVYPSKS